MKTVKINMENKILEVGIYPVKVKQYRKFKECEGNKNEPIVKISWYDAIKYCNWLSESMNFQKYYTDEGEIIDKNWNGWRLPTSYEWEFLAKGGENYKYAGSDNIDEVAWYYGNSGGKIHKCGVKKPNAFGLYDMSGNVWEWCFDKGHYENYRVLRGGSWYGLEDFTRVSYRLYSYPNLINFLYGFRVVRSE